jgi:hypothetical protein
MLQESSIGVAGLLWVYAIYLQPAIDPQRQLWNLTYTCRLPEPTLLLFISNRNALFDNSMVTQNPHVHDLSNVLLYPFTMWIRFTKIKLNKTFSDILHSFYLKITIKNNVVRKIVMLEFWTYLLRNLTSKKSEIRTLMVTRCGLSEIVY